MSGDDYDDNVGQDLMPAPGLKLSQGGKNGS